MPVTQGRCSGCGFEDASVAKVRVHVRQCPKYAALYVQDPDAALDPEAAWAAWHNEQAREDYRDKRRDTVATNRARLQALSAAKHAVEQARWTREDDAAPVQVLPPVGAVLVNKGRTDAQRAVLGELMGGGDA